MTKTCPVPVEKIKPQTITVRLLPNYKKRVEKIAEDMGISEGMLAEMGLKALVDCIEANGGRILWPPKVYVDGDKRRYEL